jgi:pSer/pThr/pTyr-binding forkhead associated (FHA) protein
MKSDMTVKLLVVQGRPYGKTLLFPSGEYYFGRGPECQVRPESEWVSRQHCLLRVTADAVFVRDLGSRNGTLVNGTLVQSERQLLHGDQVQIGPLVFEVQLEAKKPTDSGGVAANDAVTLAAENTAEVELAQDTTSTLPTTSLRPDAPGLNDSTQKQPALPPDQLSAPSSERASFETGH